MKNIFFHNQDISSPLEKKAKTQIWLNSIVSTENHTSGNINFIFCTDNYLLEINKQYLSHDYFTDVITFDYTENNLISGDIFISVDRIKENALKFKTPFSNELHRVMAHGILHLLGYKDKNKDEKKTMRSKEDEYLKLINFLS